MNARTFPLPRTRPRSTVAESAQLPHDNTEPRSRRAAWWLLVASVVMYMVLSGPVLFTLGMPYATLGGPAISKIHPGTYFMLASWLVGLASWGNPLGVLGGQLRRHKLLSGYFACMLGVFVWATGRHGFAGLAFIIDTLLMPAVGTFALLLHSRQRQRQMLVLIMSLLLLNAVLAIGEAATGRRLFPLPPFREDYIEEKYFRASALMGHPLVNAFTSIALMPAIGTLPWRLHWRMAAAAVMVLAIFSFGSRSVLAGLAVYGVVLVLPMVWRLLRGGYGYLQVTGGLVAAALGVTLLSAAVMVTGVGDRIFKNLTWDNSANVRVRVWQVLDYLHDEALWFGMPIPRIDQIALRVGIDPQYEAIENFWLYMLLLLGIVGFALFVGGLACLVWHMWRIAQVPLRTGVLVFFAVASGANTLSSKGMILVMLAMVVQAAAQYPAKNAAQNAGFPRSRR
jgi:MFS family permease